VTYKHALVITAALATAIPILIPRRSKSISEHIAPHVPSVVGTEPMRSPERPQGEFVEISQAMIDKLNSGAATATEREQALKGFKNKNARWAHKAETTLADVQEKLALFEKAQEETLQRLKEEITDLKGEL